MLLDTNAGTATKLFPSSLQERQDFHCPRLPPTRRNFLIRQGLCRSLVLHVRTDFANAAQLLPGSRTLSPTNSTPILGPRRWTRPYFRFDVALQLTTCDFLGRPSAIGACPPRTCRRHVPPLPMWPTLPLLPATPPLLILPARSAPLNHQPRRRKPASRRRRPSRNFHSPLRASAVG